MQTPNGYPYDPLATNFMAPGMQYMPRAQDMTDPSYGAFRTMPTYSGNPVSQRPTMWQSYLNMNEGRLPGLGFLGAYTMNTYNPAVNQMELQARSAARFNSGIMAAKGAAADFAMGWGAQQMFGGGTLLGLGANIAVSGSGIFSGAINDRIAAAYKIQDMTAPLITFGQDARSTGRGFNMRAATSFDNNLRSMSASDPIFGEEDYRKMTQLGMKHGLFKYGNTAEQFKRTSKQMSEDVKILMSIWENADMDDVMSKMGRMQTMGANRGLFSSIGKQEAMFARMVGISHQDMVNTYGAQGAMIYAQHGLTGYQGSLENMASAGSVAAAQRLGLITPGMLNRMGGEGGAAQEFTENKAKGFLSIRDMVLGFAANGNMDGLSPKAIEDIKSGKFDFQEMMRVSGSRLTSPGGMAMYKANKEDLTEKFKNSMTTSEFQEFLARYAEQVGATLNGPGATREENIVSGSMTALQMREEAAKFLAKLETNTEYKKNLRDQERKQKTIEDMNANAAALYASSTIPRYGRRLKENWNEFQTKFGKHPVSTFADEQDTEERLKYGPAPLSTYGGYAPNQDRNAVTIESESGGNNSAIQPGSGHRGYGPIQLDSANHEEFFREGNEGAPWREKFRGLALNSAEYRAMFAALLRDDPNFAAATIAFNHRRNVTPTEEKLKQMGLDLSGKGLAMDSQLTSLGTQLGPGLAPKAIFNALGNGKWDGKNNIEAFKRIREELLTNSGTYFARAIRDNEYSPEGERKRRDRELQRFTALEMNQGTDSAGFDPRSVQFADKNDELIYNVANQETLSKASKTSTASAKQLLAKYGISESTLAGLIREEITVVGDLSISTLLRIISRALRIDNPGMRSLEVTKALTELTHSSALQVYIGSMAMELNGDDFKKQVSAENTHLGASRKVLPSANKKAWDDLDEQLATFAPRMKGIGNLITQTDSGAIAYLQNSMKGNKHTLAVQEFAKYCVLYTTNRNEKDIAEREARALGAKLSLTTEDCSRSLARGKIPGDVLQKIAAFTGLHLSEVTRLVSMGEAAAENNSVAKTHIAGGAARVTKMEDTRKSIIAGDTRDGIETLFQEEGLTLSALKNKDSISSALEVIGDKNPRVRKLLQQALQIATDYAREDHHRGHTITERLVDANSKSEDLRKIGAAERKFKEDEASKKAEADKTNALTNNTKGLVDNTEQQKKSEKVMADLVNVLDPTHRTREAVTQGKETSSGSVPPAASSGLDILNAIRGMRM